MKFIVSSNPTTLASVELLVLIFCFIDNAITAPLTKESVPRVCDKKLACTTNEESTDQVSVPDSSQPSINGNEMVDLMYLMVLVN